MMNDDLFNLQNRYRLKYEISFLKPALTETQVNTHVKEHLYVYYANLEVLVQDANLVEMSTNLTKLVQHCFGKQDLLSIFNNAGQIINHIYYFETFVPKEFTKEQVAQLKSKFPNVDALITQIKSTIDKHGFGSCWLWIAFDKTNDIKIFITPNAFSVHNIDFISQVICCIDLWEHAYYIDYYSKRDEYLSNIIKLTNLYNQIF